jgi:hypothetical protein
MPIDSAFVVFESEFPLLFSEMRKVYYGQWSKIVTGLSCTLADGHGTDGLSCVKQ